MTLNLTGRSTVLVPGHRGPVPQIYRTHQPRELTAGQAPVAVRARINLPASFDEGAAPRTFEDIRWSDGRFYRAFTIPGTPVAAHSPQYESLQIEAGSYPTEEEAVRKLDEFLDGHILIDGFLWRQTSEPVLDLDSDGRHILVISNGGRYWHPILPWRTFSLKEPALAVEAAANLRRRSGAGLKPDPSASSPCFELLMPETITGPMHADLLKAAYEEARATAAAAVKDLLTDFTGPKMQEVGQLLLTAGLAYEGQVGKR